MFTLQLLVKKKNKKRKFEADSVKGDVNKLQHKLTLDLIPNVENLLLRSRKLLKDRTFTEK